MSYVIPYVVRYVSRSPTLGFLRFNRNSSQRNGAKKRTWQHGSQDSSHGRTYHRSLSPVCVMTEMDQARFARTQPPPTSPNPRTPRNTLSRELVVESALRLLDSRGKEAFTMRALASEMGVGAMTLYTYFRGKDELFAAARDRILDRYQPPREDGSPRDRIRAACLAVYRLFAEHPCVVELLIGRPIRGDEATATVDHMLGLLLGAGLERSRAAQAHIALMQYTLGVTLWAARGRARMAADDGHGLVERCAALPPDRYPFLVDLAPELAATTGQGQFEIGLDALLIGLLGPE